MEYLAVTGCGNLRGRMATKKKDPAAVALGRRGGKKKVPKGFSMMDAERRSEISRKAIKRRWDQAKKKKK
jgi:hypothetical protein